MVWSLQSQLLQDVGCSGVDLQVLALVYDNKVPKSSL
jgi:hypothetical protein